MTKPYAFHHVGLAASKLDASDTFYSVTSRHALLGSREGARDGADARGATEPKGSNDTTVHSMEGEAFDELTANVGSGF